MTIIIKIQKIILMQKFQLFFLFNYSEHCQETQTHHLFKG